MTDKQKFVVRIQGVEYAIVSREADEYVQGVALTVDKKLTEIMAINSRLSTASASVLTALNLADELRKSEMNCDNLRTQVANYLDEVTELKAEITNYKAQITDRDKTIRDLEIAAAKQETKLGGATEKRLGAY